ncbi:hypothetical protein [Anaerohalosphaera lusitana]|uniref:hypothetical protein n=1 Tax=Anaerohalosphaera lusitana TaxID=1936003 RepID=UPI001474A1BE|nr:hypothetical protein [Anaerohalosphaera lusitana]
MIADGDTYWYHRDGLGSIVALSKYDSQPVTVPSSNDIPTTRSARLRFATAAARRVRTI